MPRGTIGSIACGHPLAARVGTDSLVSGGNAVDAAIAAAYALMVVLPEACGIGGDAIFLVSAPEGTRAFNGSGRSPQGFSAPLAADGAATATVPGAVAALELAGQRFGRGQVLPLQGVNPDRVVADPSMHKSRLVGRR